jgi:hypothetical protein
MKRRPILTLREGKVREADPGEKVDQDPEVDPEPENPTEPERGGGRMTASQTTGGEKAGTPTDPERGGEKIKRV